MDNPFTDQQFTIQLSQLGFKEPQKADRYVIKISEDDFGPAGNRFTIKVDNKTFAGRNIQVFSSGRYGYRDFYTEGLYVSRYVRGYFMGIADNQWELLIEPK